MEKTTFLKRLGADLHEAWPQIAVALVLFIAAGIWGAIDTRIGSAALEAFSEIAQGLVSKDLGPLILAIFLRNSMAAAITMFGGTLFGLIPLAAILFNGVLFGTVLRFFPGEFWKIIPHGVFELPAMFICWGFGLWIGLSLFTRPSFDTLRKRLGKGVGVYLRLILPLLALAAAIEGFAAHLYRS